MILQAKSCSRNHSDSGPVDLNIAFSDLSLLHVKQMIDFTTATTVFNSVHGNCPEYLADMLVPAQQIHNHEIRHSPNGLFPSYQETPPPKTSNGIIKDKINYNCMILQAKSCSRNHSDSEPADLNTAFSDLSLLNVKQMIDFNTATMVFDSIHGNCPVYLADMLVPAQKIPNHETRHSLNGLFPPHINLVARQQSFLNRGCHVKLFPTYT